jgi:hypothetical protein
MVMVVSPGFCRVSLERIGRLGKFGLGMTMAGGRALDAPNGAQAAKR